MVKLKTIRHFPFINQKINSENTLANFEIVSKFRTYKKCRLQLESSENGLKLAIEHFDYEAESWQLFKYTSYPEYNCLDTLEAELLGKILIDLQIKLFPNNNIPRIIWKGFNKEISICGSEKSRIVLVKKDCLELHAEYCIKDSIGAENWYRCTKCYSGDYISETDILTKAYLYWIKWCQMYEIKEL